jgi:tetratricopeptide (TPR) repeat protein
MLVIIRSYASEALLHSGELDSALSAHLLWTIEQARELGTLFLGADPDRADQMIVALFDNFLAAFDYAQRAGRVQDAAQLAFALSEYLILEGRFEIVSRWFSDLSTVDLAAADHARVLMLDAVASYFRGVYNLASEEAIETLDAALELAEQLPDLDLVAEICTELGAVHWAAGSGLSEGYYHRALELGSSYTRIRALNGLGGVRAAHADHTGALKYFQESAHLARAAGYITREIIGQFNSAHSLSVLGRHDEARAILIACLERARRSVRALVPGICESLGECALASGNIREAISWFRDGAQDALAMGNTATAHALQTRLDSLNPVS